MPGPRSVTLTLYLIKEGYEEPGKCLEQRPGLVRRVVRAGRQRLGTLYIKPPQEHPPAWVSFFEGNIRDLLFNANSSAVFLTAAQQRTFALTFGYGRALLDPAAYAEQFGLKVTLNAVGAANIRTVDHLRLDSAQHGRIQASRATPIAEFGLDIDQDLLRAVTGQPRSAGLGRHLAGRDALQATVKLTLADLPDLLARLLAEYGKQDYKQEFPWVDHIHEVHDVRIRSRLEDNLIEHLRTSRLDRKWLAVPEIVDWARISGFKYRLAQAAPEYPDLHLKDFLAEHSNSTVLDIDDLKRRYVHAMSSETDQVLERWPVYRCLYAEIDDGDDTYILTNGAWYRVARDFANVIDAAVASIPTPDIPLPAYADADEEAYNRRAAQSPGFALMDRQLITYPGGSDKIELCDLYTIRREFIHIKRYSGSAPLSHLFGQGVVAAELFLQEPEFRRRANACLPPTQRLPDPTTRPNPADYTVVYGIVSQSASPLRLPFFSKVTLRNAARRLSLLGYKVGLVKIPIQATALGHATTV